MYNRIFFTNLLRLLDQHGLNRKELSEKTGVSQGFLSDLANGKANPSLRVMEQIARAFSVPLSELLEHVEPEFLDEIGLPTSDNPAQMEVPKGFERITVTLPEHQAYQARQWETAALKKLKK